MTQIEFTGRHVDVPDNVKALVARKMKKLEKVLGDGTNAHVVLTVEKHRSHAEVTVTSPHVTLQAKEEGVDFGAALASILDKLTRQVQTRIGKLQDRRRRAAKAKAKAPAGA